MEVERTSRNDRRGSGSHESPSSTVLGSVMSDALACQSGCCRGGHCGGDRRRVFSDRQRDRATGPIRRTRSQPQLWIRRRPVRVACRRLDSAGIGRRPHRSALQRRGLPVRVGQGFGDGRRHLLVVSRPAVSAANAHLATERGATVTEKVVERHQAFLARRDTTGAACSATAAAGTGGTRAGGCSFAARHSGDPCKDAEKLLTATLQSDM